MKFSIGNVLEDNTIQTIWQGEICWTRSSSLYKQNENSPSLFVLACTGPPCSFLITGLCSTHFLDQLLLISNPWLVLLSSPPFLLVAIFHRPKNHSQMSKTHLGYNGELKQSLFG